MIWSFLLSLGRIGTRQFSQSFQNSIGTFKLVVDMKKTLYCPVCKKERRIADLNPRVPLICIIVSSSIIAVMVHWVWSVVGLITLAISEGVFRLIRRRFYVCPICDFDPYLYSRDISAARLKVEKKVADHLAAQQKLNTEIRLDKTRETKENQVEANPL